jgi:hypothetical protein
MGVTTHVWVHYVQIDMCIEPKMEQWILVKITVSRGVQHDMGKLRVTFVSAHERQPPAAKPLAQWTFIVHKSPYFFCFSLKYVRCRIVMREQIISVG